MDSTLEEEIARLSRPQTAEDVNIEHGFSSAGTSVPQGHLSAPQSVDTLPAGRIIAHPAPSGPPSGNAAVAPWRSGAASNNVPRRPEMSRQGSGKSSGSARTSPPGRAAAVLAGDALSDVQAPAVPPQAGGPQQHLHHQAPTQRGAVRGNTANGSNGGSGRLAANGEKVSGFKPGGSAPSPAAAASAAAAAAAMANRADGRGSDPRLGGSGATGVGGTKKISDEETWRRSEEALKKKEMSVRQALRDKQRTLQQETRLLATVDRELTQLALNHQTEINDLRKTLESVDRELAILDKDAQRKLEAFEKARTLLSAKVTEKQGITTRLTQLIMASERQKDAKLNEIMKKMATELGSVDAVSGKQDARRLAAGEAHTAGSRR